MRLWLSTNKGVFQLRREGPMKWAVHAHHFKGVAAPIVTPDPSSGRVYAALKHGHFGSKLHMTADDGQTWSPLEAPAYPPYPDGQPPEINPMSGKPLSWSLEMIWAIEPGAPGSDELWCGTLPGGVFRSTDAGRSWAICDSLWRDPRRKTWFGGGYDTPGVHSVCVDPRDPRHVVIGISCGGIWETRDSGDTWSLIGKGMLATYMPPGQQEEPGSQDPHLLAACPASFDHMWVQHHCGMFRSTDGAQTFAPIGPKPGGDPSGFGFAVAPHPTDPDTAYFAPAIADEMRLPVGGRVELTRTRDGGKTFEPLGNGLPRHDAHDLVYRHALAISRDGNTLAFGSTTGNLFISEDAGEHFTTVSAHLPPIFSVRFG